MSQLIVIGFDSEADAFALRDELAKAQKEYLLKLEDAVVVTRPTEGEYQLHQALNLTSAGALGGGFWGGLIGLLFLNPLAGAAIGAGAGALAGSATDYGIPDDFIRQIGKTVPLGSGAVFILAQDFNLDKLLPRLERYGSRARVIQTSMSNADEERLRHTLGAAGWPAASAAAHGAGAAGGAPVGGAATVAAEAGPMPDVGVASAGHHPVPPEKL
ncbi:DUF1269 domain-containing protein [Paracoccus sanguinis]|uniref:DUF1269 domain-containing protein n=1 Tax=Paracoccus sanguinis TaxID=1545044 RepID=UPI0009DE1CBB|nr:DUF1269 domain-containing protein [Paracoccus sanguinis]